MINLKLIILICSLGFPVKEVFSLTTCAVCECQTPGSQCLTLDTPPAPCNKYPTCIHCSTGTCTNVYYQVSTPAN